MDRDSRNLLQTKTQSVGEQRVSGKMPTKTGMQEGEHIYVVANGILREYIKMNNVLWYTDYLSATGLKDVLASLVNHIANVANPHVVTDTQVNIGVGGSIAFNDADGGVHAVTIVNGRVTSWTLNSDEQLS